MLHLYLFLGITAYLIQQHSEGETLGYASIHLSNKTWARRRAYEVVAAGGPASAEDPKGLCQHTNAQID